MTLLNATMLIVAGALAVPIILHLIHRQEFPVVHVPTTRFLDVTRRSNVLHLRLVDVVQLLLRLGVLAFLVAAIARPFVASSRWGKGPVANRVLVLDTSVRMHGKSEGATCLERARAKVAELVAQSNPRDRWALVAADRHARVVLPLGANGAEVQAALASVTPTYFGPAALLEGMGLSLDMVAAERELVNAVYVLSTFPENAFQPAACSRAAQSLEAARAALGDRLAVHLVSFAPEQARDAAITGCQRGQEKVIMGLPARLSPVFENLTGEEQQVDVRLAVGGKPMDARQITLPKGARYVTDFFYTFNRPREAPCEFSLGPDTLDANNHAAALLDIDAVDRVLIVDGTSDGEPAAPATTGAGLIAYALSPDSLLGQGNRTGLAAEVVRPGELRKLILYNYKVIILYNVTSLPPGDAGDLLTACREGKGILIVPGEDVRSAEFNRAMAAGGLSPAELRGIRDAAQPLQAGPWMLSHPLGRQYRDLRSEGLADVVWTRRFEARPLQGSEVVLAASGGSPLLITRSVGRGSVALLAFDVMPSWTNLPLTSSYVPLLHRLVAYLSGRRRADDGEGVFVGETFTSRLKPGAVTRGVEVRDPSGRIETVQAAEDGSVAYASTALPGVYTVKPVGASALSERPFTVNLRPEDARARPLGNEELRSRLADPRLALAAPEELVLAAPKGFELWRWLLVAALVLYAVEAVSAWAVVKKND